MDFKEFHDLIESLFQCGECKKRLDAPVFCCGNGHAICKNCRDIISDCPLDECDNTEISNNHQTLVNNLVKTFQFKCKFSDFGCNEVGIPDDLKQHESGCDYRKIACVLLYNGQICKDEISIPNYADHIEHCHDSYIISYTLNSQYYTTLPKRSNLENNMFHYRILKDDQLYFLEMIFYDKVLKAYQISVHFIDKKEANNFTYLIEIDENEEAGILHYKYGNRCIANVMSPEEARKKCPLILFDENDRFSVHNEVKYHLKIMKTEDFSKTVA